ncbi:MAG: hypothetical protein FRX49_13231 [Trebouxia sp. A1-2]|nr:MAG: hypothetical protein FRX49_13231 [Trebouxia sp. A1-2]
MYTCTKGLGSWSGRSTYHNWFVGWVPSLTEISRNLQAAVGWGSLESDQPVMWGEKETNAGSTNVYLGTSIHDISLAGAQYWISDDLNEPEASKQQNEAGVS